MARPVVLIADPGIDGAFAIALALNDPELEVVGLAATAGNVNPEQATQNVHALLGMFDPPRWPRVGTALPIPYAVDGQRLHGPGGLGGLSIPVAPPHHAHLSDKLIADLIRQHPHEIEIIVLGPMTALARAMDRDPDLPALVRRIVAVGGTLHEPGNASPVAEFHFYCDPSAARQVLRCGAPLTLVPLDVSRKLLFSPSELLDLPNPESPTTRLLRKIVPHGIGATANLYGVEGFHLKDVLGIAALALPGSVSTKAMVMDVETRGELTSGMCVVDARWTCTAKPNVDVGVGVDDKSVRQYVRRVLEGIRA